MLIHKEASNSASDQICFDKLVAEDSFRKVCRLMITRKLTKNSKNVTINSLDKFQ